MEHVVTFGLEHRVLCQIGAIRRPMFRQCGGDDGCCAPTLAPDQGEAALAAIAGF